MPRILGLDVGERRIGVAISDESRTIAQGLDTIQRDKNTLASLREIIQEYGVGEIVVGLPRNMNDSLGPQAQKVLSFIEELRASLGLPVATWDERLTSWAAAEVLRETGMPWRKQRKAVDRVAAALILQGYLDSKHGGGHVPVNQG